MNELKDIRRAWYQAFYQGDIEALQKYETDNFVFISGTGIERQNRYVNIQARVENGSWFKAKVFQKEQRLEFKPLSEKCCLVTGIAEANTEQCSFGAVYFSEVWSKSGNNWRVESLHVSNVDKVQ
ncbi:DUF4440 domain-containing protein [Litoribacillus peritrichatus]|uniref:DUF4440 domain-containing protein n=1 Tax=Litoribacillus peritrichatus TaxID=718191 RepID=A0ABP7MIT9_9GAMM